MTEEEKKDFTNRLASPEAGFALAYDILSMHAGGIFFDTPEENGFPAIRFLGRFRGYIYAIVRDRMKPENEIRINIDTITPYATKEELDALEKLQQKVKEQAEKDIPPFDDGYVGMYEGMAIYLNKEDVSLLYAETDIDLNKDSNDGAGIPSYAYHKAMIKAGAMLANWNKTKSEVVATLIGDGIAEKGATIIAERMIAIVKSQRKKAAIKGIAIGLIIMLIGIVITGVTYLLAASNGGGKYLITYGAICGGAVMLAMGISNYVKASRDEG